MTKPRSPLGAPGPGLSEHLTHTSSLRRPAGTVPWAIAASLDGQGRGPASEKAIQAFLSLFRRRGTGGWPRWPLVASVPSQADSPGVVVMVF